jgi:transcriptional antiterminator RfaH
VFRLENVSCCTGAWYLIHCQGKKERYASHVLENQLGLSTFFPEYTHCSHGKIRKLPLFPGYLFAQLDLQLIPLSRINAMPGVIRLVVFGGEPQPVPLDVIEAIHKRLAQFNAASLRPFQPGEIVRIKQGGPLQDLEMIFVGPTTSRRRVTLLLNLLGRSKEIQVDIEKLERVTSFSFSQ